MYGSCVACVVVHDRSSIVSIVDMNLTTLILIVKSPREMPHMFRFR